MESAPQDIMGRGGEQKGEGVSGPDGSERKMGRGGQVWEMRKKDDRKKGQKAENVGKMRKRQNRIWATKETGRDRAAGGKETERRVR